ncbi:hypothetical protein AC1031_004941 [Aphanomyces cochlioides]|nr:hypothetical protein AC1031_004941 [Aphanomyces cochlioides]
MSTGNARQVSTLDEIRGMRVSKSTKSGYKSGLNQIKKWILNHGSSDMLKSDGSINLEVFTHEQFIQFIAWTFQNTSNKPGTISSYREVLRWDGRTATSSGARTLQ